jgi:hypothetical protein
MRAHARSGPLHLVEMGDLEDGGFHGVAGCGPVDVRFPILVRGVWCTLRDAPQGLKPRCLCGFNGTAEAVPFQYILCATSSMSTQHWALTGVAGSLASLAVNGEVSEGENRGRAGLQGWLRKWYGAAMGLPLRS